MRTQLRNKVKLYYANPTGQKTEVTDDGYATGVFEAEYATPTERWLNVMPKGGEADIEIFGKTTDYSKVGVDTTDCPITEYSRIWLDGIDPETTTHNYVVKKVNASINSVLIAFAEVKTQAANDGNA